MINFDDLTKGNKKEYNSNWPQITDHLHKILMVGVSLSEKTNFLFYPIRHQPDVDQIDLFAKVPYEANYQLLLHKKKYRSKVFKWF